MRSPYRLSNFFNSSISNFYLESMFILIIAFFFSFIITLVVIRFGSFHLHLSADSDLSGVQKFHKKPVPRIGGVAIFLSIICCMPFINYTNSLVYSSLFYLVLSSIPVFSAGLLEDLTKKIGVKFRLLAAVMSAIIAGFFLNTWLIHIDLLGIDYLLQITFFSVLFTCFAVAGVSNAFNLIDGYNGLSSMVSIIIFSGLAYLSWVVGDRIVFVIAIIAIASVFGFLLWNYPHGLIFLGDGGAYLIGFWVAEISILLVTRNQSISPWCVFLMVAYPVFETIFTICRRFFRGTRVSQPDAAHLHQLFYRFVVRWAVGSNSWKKNKQRNSLTSIYLWVMTIFCVAPAVLFWQNVVVLKLIIVFFVVVYILIYYLIISKKFPRFAMIRLKK